jgi:3-methylcrotonyl-CoA carboxylase alpha subunit
MPCEQQDIKSKGHAIECRIYAEDPHKDFIPSVGKVNFLKTPAGDGIRVDSGIVENSKISMYYDPMAAKLITYGENRGHAIKRMQKALVNYHIGGVKTNISFLLAIINHPKFINYAVSTNFLSHEKISLPTHNQDLLVFLAASVDYLSAQNSNKSLLHKDTFAWQMHLASQWRNSYIIDGEKFDVLINPVSHDTVKIILKDKTVQFQIKMVDGQLYYNDGKQCRRIWLQNNHDHVIFYTSCEPVTVRRFNWQVSQTLQDSNAQLTAPMPATIVAIFKKKGDKVKSGEPLMVLEAMKMEHTITAFNDGKVTDIFYEVGNQVSDGAELLSITASEAKELEPNQND